ncbi:MAG: hypothetical protein LBE86_00475, partial [Gemmobacter sp.]|nr:hypothetical protein [Gemmobacter sp.]
MIKKLFGWLLNPVLLTILALLVLALLIWWIGPLVRIGALAPLESERSRALLIGLIVLLVVLRVAFRRWRAWRANLALTAGLMRSAAPSQAAQPAQAANPEQAVLTQRFTEARATLKHMRLTAAGRPRSSRLG